MNQTTGHFTTLDPFKEDACPVTLAEEEVLNPRPTLIYVSVQEFLPDKLQPIGNTLPFCQTYVNLVGSTTYTAAEACHEGLYLPYALRKVKTRHTVRRPN
ncbi:MAG: hypothetical protein MUP49_04065 [Dehalococcoidia bacterium]|nr:hypothetical protein [Dehalococcoidia bacterium]